MQIHFTVFINTLDDFVETNEIKMFVIDDFDEMIIERNKEDLKVIKRRLNADVQVLVACKVLTQEILDACRTITNNPCICHR